MTALSTSFACNEKHFLYCICNDIPNLLDNSIMYNYKKTSYKMPIVRYKFACKEVQDTPGLKFSGNDLPAEKVVGAFM